jgi:lysozyme
MKLSPAGLAFLQAQEGFRAQAYPDPATHGAPYTVGYGSTRWEGHPVPPDLVVTEAHALVQLSADVGVLETLLAHVVTVPLTQGQIDALISFIYNVGAHAFVMSHVLRALNHGNYAQAAEHLLDWDHAIGRVVPGLRARRERERALFLGEVSHA